MADEDKHVIDVIGLAQERAAEILNDAWPGREISKEQVVIHVVMDGGDDDPFIYTAVSREATDKMKPELRKRLAESLARTGEELLQGLTD